MLILFLCALLFVIVVLGCTATFFVRKRQSIIVYKRLKFKPCVMSRISLPATLVRMSALNLVCLVGVPWRLEGGKTKAEISFEAGEFSGSAVPYCYSFNIGKSFVCYKAGGTKLKVALGKKIIFCFTNSRAQEYSTELRVRMEGNFDALKKTKEGVIIKTNGEAFLCGIENATLKTKIEKGTQTIMICAPVKLESGGTKEVEFKLSPLNGENRVATKLEVISYVHDNFGVFCVNNFVVRPEFRYLTNKEDSLQQRHAISCLKRDKFKLTLPMDTGISGYKDITSSFKQTAEYSVCFTNSFEDKLCVNLKEMGFNEYSECKIKKGIAELCDLMTNFKIFITAENGIKKARLVNFWGRLLLALDITPSRFVVLARERVLNLSAYAVKQAELAYKALNTNKFKLEEGKGALKRVSPTVDGIGLVAEIKRETIKAIYAEDNALTKLYQNLYIDNLNFDHRFRVVSGLLSHISASGDESLLADRRFCKHLIEGLSRLHEIEQSQARCFAVKVLPFIKNGNIVGQLLKFLAGFNGKQETTCEFEYMLSFVLGIRVRGDKVFFKPSAQAGDFKLCMLIKGKKVEFVKNGEGKQLYSNGMLLGNLDFINLSAHTEDVLLIRA